MTFKVGDSVTLAPNYPFQGVPKKATGNIVALPDEKHPEEYQIELDGGPIFVPFLKGRTFWVSAAWLEPTPKK